MKPSHASSNGRMARHRKLAAAALTLTTVVVLVEASSLGAPNLTPPKLTPTSGPTPIPTLAPSLARKPVMVPKAAPVRPLTLPSLRDGGKPVATATATAVPVSTKPGPGSGTAADAGAKPPASTPTLTTAPAVLSAAQKSSFVDKINGLRASLGASSMQPIRWDDDLASFASTFAAQCLLGHTSTTERMNIAGWTGTYVGENVAAGSPATLADATNPSVVSADLESALNNWWNEKASYDYASNTCATGQVCGHFTQVAWASTRSVGCAVVMCQPHAVLGNAYSVVCEFGPGGNYIGERPY